MSFRLVILMMMIVFPVRILQTQETVFSDTLRVYSIRSVTDLRSGQVEGARLTIHFDLKYDGKRHKYQKPVVLELSIRFLTSDGRPVQASPGTVYHLSKEGYATTGFSEMRWSNPKDVFIPYYALDLPAGRHSLLAILSASVKDTAATQDSRPIVVSGKTETTLQIHKPKSRMFRMVVRELRVHPYNEKGEPWDSGLFSSAHPDLMYQIQLRSKEHTDIIHTSTTMQDALSAGWIDFPDPVTISENDRITLSVYDKDLFFHDKIGEISHPLNDWLRLGNEKQSMVFGKVTSCAVDIEEIIKE